MTTPQEQEFHLQTAKSLGRIEAVGIETQHQVTALNATVSVDSQRISKLEGSLKALKALGALIIAGVVAATGVVAALWRH